MKLDALAPFSTTGIGGAPAGAFGFQCDVPYLVELVREGETLLSGREPSLWPWFLSEVRARTPKFVKVQVPGPLTAPIDTRERIARYVPALKEAGVTPLVFVDEPMLTMEVDPAPLRALRDCISEVGAISGLHCCAQAPWPQVLELGFDVVSFDVRLSLDALVEDSASWRRFVESGAWLAAGIIPTDGKEPYDVKELCEALVSALGDFQRVLLTPACGLGLFDEAGASAVTTELHEAQTILRASHL